MVRVVAPNSHRSLESPHTSRKRPVGKKLYPDACPDSSSHAACRFAISSGTSFAESAHGTRRATTYARRRRAAAPVRFATVNPRGSRRERIGPCASGWLAELGADMPQRGYITATLKKIEDPSR